VIDVKTDPVDAFTYKTEATTMVTHRSIHMSFWDVKNGEHGKAIVRTNVLRDSNGKIFRLQFDKSASIGLEKMAVVANAEAFTAETL
jgi:hypothetical protein